jgi:quercetin 2,3-dioxygenase
MRVGEDTFRLGPGDALLAPRGVPHSFASVTDRARMLVTFLPAGDMEAFFREASALEAPTPPEMAAVFGRHGMQVLGPPLPV